MKTRDRKRRPRGGPNPGRLNRHRDDMSDAEWLIAIKRGKTIYSYDYAKELDICLRCSTPRQRRYVRIRLKEASR